MKKIVIFILLCCNYAITSAQNNLQDYVKETYKNLLVLQEENNLEHEKAVSLFLEMKGLNVKKNICDEIIKQRDTINNIIIYKYNHKYNGITVEDSKLFCSESPAGIKEMWGSIKNTKGIAIDPKINSDQALKNALLQLGELNYAWLNKNWELSLRKEMNDSSATYQPKGELVITKVNDTEQGDKCKLTLAWKYEILSLDPLDCFYVYVNAITGKYFKRRNLINEAEGDCITLYNGSQNFTTNWRGFPNYNYNLKDETRGELCVKWSNNVNIWGWNLASHITDDDNHWSAVEERPATSLLWGLEKTYDYFKNKFYWNGTAGNNNTLRGLANAGGVASSFVLNGTDYIETGFIGGYSTADLEVISHEYTHRIISHTSNLIYENYLESGALNESFADIFGISSYYYTTGENDWHLGTNIGGLRDFINPHYYRTGYQPQPIYYGEPGYWDPSDVHINGGVQNHWFYLLAHGGNGYNGIHVDGIGIEKAARIAWYTMRNLVSDATFTDSRNVSITMAGNLYGPVSCERKQCQNAWAAVNVGTATNSNCYPPISVNMNSLIALCYYNCGQYTASISGGSGNFSIYWDASFSDGSHQYGANSNQYYFCCNNNTSSYVDVSIHINDGYQTATATDRVYLYDCGYFKSTNNNMLVDSSSFDKAQNNVIKIVPNPVSEGFNIFYPVNENNVFIEISNMSNKTILSTYSNTSPQYIDTNALPNGLYFIKLKIDGNIYIEKFIINKK